MFSELGFAESRESAFRNQELMNSLLLNLLFKQVLKRSNSTLPSHFFCSTLSPDLCPPILISSWSGTKQYEKTYKNYVSWSS